jgi:hypothetical protein
VFWISRTPTSAPTLLQPMSLLGLDADVQTSATGYDTAGVIVGVSINNTGTETPVVWSSAGVPTALQPPLLSVNTNCAPADLNDAATPSIIGNCDNSGTGGGNKAVLWASASSAYTVLPVPTFATYCSADAINLSGQIMGECTYGTDTHRVVLWAPGGTTAPQVLSTILGQTAYRTYGADLNDSGEIACNYLSTASATAGFKEPCEWNTAGGNTNAVAITEPGGANGPAILIGLANDGKAIGVFETASGDIQSFSVPSGGSAGVNLGSPEGGGNTVVTSISKTGNNLAAASEDTTLHTHDVEEPTP